MLNENIRAIRKARGLSQQELAVQLNVVRQTLSKWEQGRSVPDADMLIALSQALETPVSTLLGETVSPPAADDMKASRGQAGGRQSAAGQTEACLTLVGTGRAGGSLRRPAAGLCPSGSVGQPLSGVGLRRSGNRRDRRRASCAGVDFCPDGASAPDCSGSRNFPGPQEKDRGIKRQRNQKTARQILKDLPRLCIWRRKSDHWRKKRPLPLIVCYTQTIKGTPKAKQE